MIGILDPALFLPRSDADVQQDFDTVLRICKEHDILIPELDEYWHELWSALGASLEKQLSPVTKRALQEVRKLGVDARQKLNVPPLKTPAGRVWRKGFQQMFGAPPFDALWEERIAAASVRAVAMGTEVVMLTRRVLGRNLVRHSADHSVLDENTRWMLHLQPEGMGPTQVLCIYHQRNLRERWTTRFDWRLPSAQQGGRYPFCPPQPWWKGSTKAWRTKLTKHAWLDQHENGWARPNIPNGAGYHWDVYVNSAALQHVVGLSQINVVEYGAPEKEGHPGEIHHVPAAKAGHITGVGWSCD